MGTVITHEHLKFLLDTKADPYRLVKGLSATRLKLAMALIEVGCIAEDAAYVRITDRGEKLIRFAAVAATHELANILGE